MKRFILSLLIVAVVCFGFVGCSDITTTTNSNTDTPSSSDTGTVKSTEAKVEVVSEKLLKYLDALSSPEALYLAEIENTGNVSVKLSDISIDLENANGEIMGNTDYVSAYPNVIQPGEKAYIAESCMPFGSDDISLDDVGKAILHFEAEKVANVKKVNTDVSELKITEEYDRPKVVGRIKNNGDEELTDLYVAFPIRGEDGSLQTVIFTIIDSLKPGEQKGFDQSAMYADSSFDYTKSTVEAIAYLSQF